MPTQLYMTNEEKFSTGLIIVAISALRFRTRVTLKKDWSFTRHHSGSQECPKQVARLFSARNGSSYQLFL